MASQEGAQPVLALPSQDSHPQPHKTHTLTQSKYSKRVILNSILGSNDKGLSFLGERVVIGGWVKSAREKVKEGAVAAPTGLPPKTPTTTPKEVTCAEALGSRIPLFRSIFKAFGGGQNPIREKLELAGVVKPVNYIGGQNPIREKLELAGVVKPVNYIAYLQVNDGSCVQNLQVVLDSSIARLSQFTSTGTSILVEGVLRKPTLPGKHDVELEVEKVIHVGTVDDAIYPLTKTRIPLDSLRSYCHLRPRTTTVATVTKLRSSLSQATHAFSQNHGFLHVHMPIITGIDSKGFSEKFQVTALLGKESSRVEPSREVDKRPINLEVVRGSIQDKSKRIEELKRTESNREALLLALHDLKKANELASQLEAQEKSNLEIGLKAGKGSSKDFFPRQMYLTVSSQLHLESYACALGNVYSFGPTFQAETSQPTKHLAESWMVELEIAFADLEDVMNCAEDYLKFLCHWILEHCSTDMKFVAKRTDKTIVERLQAVSSSSFERITYTEAVEVLMKVTDKTFEAKIEWGMALTDEHESYLAEEIYKRPVIIYNHPKELKPFFARVNDDGKTVSTIDVIVPKAGALIRGCQKEERLAELRTRIKEFNLSRDQYEWYLDLRRHGTVKHAGFGLEFDRMVLFTTGLSDIRDVAAFPRTCGSASH